MGHFDRAVDSQAGVLRSEQSSQNRAQMAWLQSAAQEGLEDLEHGVYLTLHSGRVIDDFVDREGNDVARELDVENTGDEIAKREVLLARKAHRDLKDLANDPMRDSSCKRTQL